jgi:hypothetical protein
MLNKGEELWDDGKPSSQKLFSTIHFYTSGDVAFVSGW